MTAKTMAWSPDTHDWIFHLSYDLEDFDGTVRCYEAARGSPRLVAVPDPDSAGGQPAWTVDGDQIFQGDAAHQAYVLVLAENQAANRAKAADDPPPG